MRPLQTAAAVLLALSLTAGSARAEFLALPPGGTGAVPAESPQTSYKDAAYVQAIFGAYNAEDGLRLLGNFENGPTEAVNLGGSEARRTVACKPAAPQSAPAPAPTAAAQPAPAPAQPGAAPAPPEDPCAERFLYLDVADSYVFGGINTVELNIGYLDQGFGPVYLDYEAIDPVQPHRPDPALAKKRVELAQRGNTDAWRTVVKVLPDARLANGLGGADLRIGGPGVLTVRTVAVIRISSVMPPPPIRVLVDDKALEFTDAFPFIDQDRVLVPLRAIFEAVGASLHWDGTTRSILAARGPRSVLLQVDNPQAWVDARPTHLDVPPRLVENRTYVPLRFAAESLGLQVQWDGQSRTVTLTMPPPEPEWPAIDIFNPPPDPPRP